MKTNKCQKFIDAITPVALASGATKIILHGKHKDNLRNVSVLMPVDGDEGVDKAFIPVAKEAWKHGVFGSINILTKDKVKDDFSAMKTFFVNHSKKHIKGFTKEGDRFVFAKAA